MIHLLSTFALMVGGGLFFFFVTLHIKYLRREDNAKVILMVIAILISFWLFNTAFALMCSSSFLSAGIGYDRTHAMLTVESPIVVLLRMGVNILSVICFIVGVVMGIIGIIR